MCGSFYPTVIQYFVTFRFSTVVSLQAWASSKVV